MYKLPRTTGTIRVIYQKKLYKYYKYHLPLSQSSLILLNILHKHNSIMENYSSSSPNKDNVFFNTFLQVTVTMFDSLGTTLNAPKRNRKYLNKGREAANEHLLHDYFVNDCLYNNDAFKCYSRLSRNLIMHITNDLK